MKIVVIGAGAMGSLFGGLLAEQDNDVTLLDIWPEHVDAINTKGLQVEREGDLRTVKIHAATTPETIGKADLAIVFVKSTQTAQAAQTAAKLISATGMVLTLQNGMGNADILTETLGGGRVLAGTTSHGATLLGPGMIRHAGSGVTTIGLWQKADSTKAQVTADLFNGAGIETIVAADVRSLIWEKLLINVGINAITALTGIKNGQIIDFPAARRLSEMAVQEAVEVARGRGICVRDDAADHVLEVARATAANRSSMGQDVDNRRQTEIDAINGAVVKYAQNAGRKVPVNETLALLVETLQAHYTR